MDVQGGTKVAEIKMRTNTNANARCCNCKQTANRVLNMFDIRFGDNTSVTICDSCNGKLFSKTLSATCKVNGRLKSKTDMAIIARRNNLEKR